MDLGSILDVFWKHLGDMLVLFWVPWRVAFSMDSGGLQEFEEVRKLEVIARFGGPKSTKQRPETSNQKDC